MLRRNAIRQKELTAPGGNRFAGGRPRYFAFAPSDMGTVSRSLSDFTMS
jgi:hypothetical protein